MTRSERRMSAVLAGIYGMRMLGLFIILPVLSLYGGEYRGATVALVALALGIHGLTQAFFQLPLGALSDAIGRKPVIVGGLVVFCIGGIVAASADSIYQLIIGRALQGAGAISSALTALAGDLSRDLQRSKMMAVIGVGVGSAFVLALVLAPLLHSVSGMAGLFIFSVALGALSILLVAFALPTVATARAIRPDVRRAFASSQLLRLYAGVFFLHAVMAANFMILPRMLVGFGLDGARHWMFYLPVLAVSFLLMLPMLLSGERKGLVKCFFLVSIGLAILGQAIWPWSGAFVPFAIGVTLFFTGFNYLEANLPALVTRFCDEDGRGSAMGVFATMQFIGIFVGALAAGFVVEHFTPSYVAFLTVSLLLVWYSCAFSMKAVFTTSNRL